MKLQYFICLSIHHYSRHNIDSDIAYITSFYIIKSYIWIVATYIHIMSTFSFSNNNETCAKNQIILNKSCHIYILLKIFFTKCHNAKTHVSMESKWKFDVLAFPYTINIWVKNNFYTFWRGFLNEEHSLHDHYWVCWSQ